MSERFYLLLIFGGTCIMSGVIACIALWAELHRKRELGEGWFPVLLRKRGR